MKRLAVIVLILTTLLVGAVGWGTMAASAVPQTHTVLVEGMKYLPNTLTIRPGDSVEFINADVVPHTVTAKGSRPFDSGMITQKASWKITVSEIGTVRYQCLYHPDMTGTIIVGSERDGKSVSQLAAVEICGGT